MKDIKLKAISFIEGGITEKGYFFYESAIDSDYGHIVGVNGLTIPKALAILLTKGVDAIANFKINIKVYPK